MKTEAVLALADGTFFKGYAFGAEKSVDQAVLGEAVFNTSMLGYQEIMTDPSYAGQIMCFTNPHIGNVGCNRQDDESSRIQVEAIICRELSPLVSNYRAEESLEKYMQRQGVLGISGIDTRMLVTRIRTKGAVNAALACGSDINPYDLVDRARTFDYEARDYVKQVTCKEAYAWQELPWDSASEKYKKISENKLWSRPHVVAIDCGIKKNILRLLLAAGFRVSVAPATISAQELTALQPDALFLSNGPGDPARLDYLVSCVKGVLGKFPIFGICLGHQVLAQALGGKTYKLKFGHRGGNHPVRDETTKKVEITVQNHGYAVNAESLKGRARITHINLNDQTVEGLEIEDLCSFCIQYHPESSPGPHDAQYLFKRFFELVVKGHAKAH